MTKPDGELNRRTFLAAAVAACALPVPSFEAAPPTPPDPIDPSPPFPDVFEAYGLLLGPADYAAIEAATKRVRIVGCLLVIARTLVLRAEYTLIDDCAIVAAEGFPRFHLSASAYAAQVKNCSFTEDDARQVV